MNRNATAAAVAAHIFDEMEEPQQLLSNIT